MASSTPPARSGIDPSGIFLSHRARAAVARAVAAGVTDYDRNRHLPRLIPVDPATLADDSTEARQRIVALLARALRAERTRGRAGHWTYDLNRHIGLKQAYAAERRALAPLHEKAGAKRKPPPVTRRRSKNQR